jgi:transposase
MDPRYWVRERWGIMYHALIHPRKAEEIARDTGVSVTTVRRVISSYNRLGLAAIETPGRGGRRHEYMSLEQERSGSRTPFSRERHKEKLPQRKK